MNGIEIMLFSKKEEMIEIINEYDVIDKDCVSDIFNCCGFSFEKEGGKWYVSTWDEINGPYKSKAEATKAFIDALKYVLGKR